MIHGKWLGARAAVASYNPLSVVDGRVRSEAIGDSVTLSRPNGDAAAEEDLVSCVADVRRSILHAISLLAGEVCLKLEHKTNDDKK